MSGNVTMSAGSHGGWSRRGILAAAGLTGAAVLSGCGRQFEQTTGEVPDEYGRRERLVLWHAFAAGNLKALQTLTDKFNESQSDIYVELQFQGTYEQTMQKLAAGIVAKQVPDLVVLSEITWRKMHLADALEPYNDYFDADLSPDNYIDQFID
jgi:sn-glycerol 3-phosphate transport system substrate-binding protein